MLIPIGTLASQAAGSRYFFANYSNPNVTLQGGWFKHAVKSNGDIYTCNNIQEDGLFIFVTNSKGQYKESYISSLGSNNNDVVGLDFDSNDNLYVAYTTYVSGFDGGLLKIDTADWSILWQKYVKENDTSDFDAISLTTTSNDEVVVIGRTEDFDPDGQAYMIWYKSDGTLDSSFNKRYNSSTSFSRPNDACAVTNLTSDNYYVYIAGEQDISSDYRGVIWGIEKNTDDEVNQTGDYSRVLYINNASNAREHRWLAICVDNGATNGAAYTVGRFYSYPNASDYWPTVARFTPLQGIEGPQYNWAKRIFDGTNDGTAEGVASDDDGNLYVVFETLNNKAGIASLDSDGNLNWQREMTFSSFDLTPRYIRMDPFGDLVIGLTGGYDVWILKVPTSGDFTGTYEFTGNTITIGTGSWTVSDAAPVQETNPSGAWLQMSNIDPVDDTQSFSEITSSWTKEYEGIVV